MQVSADESWDNFLPHAPTPRTNRQSADRRVQVPQLVAEACLLRQMKHDPLPSLVPAPGTYPDQLNEFAHRLEHVRCTRCRERFAAAGTGSHASHQPRSSAQSRFDIARRIPDYYKFADSSPT